MANIIIENRLKKLTERKRFLLTLKKDKRGNGLKETNETIGRLKRWQRELDEKDLQEKKRLNSFVNQTGNIKNVTKNVSKAFKGLSKGIGKMKDSMSRACDMINHQIDNEFDNVSKLTQHEIEFIEAMTTSGSHGRIKMDMNKPNGTWIEEEKQ